MVKRHGEPRKGGGSTARACAKITPSSRPGAAGPARADFEDSLPGTDGNHPAARVRRRPLEGRRRHEGGAPKTPADRAVHPAPMRVYILASHGGQIGWGTGLAHGSFPVSQQTGGRALLTVDIS